MVSASLKVANFDFNVPKSLMARFSLAICAVTEFNGLLATVISCVTILATSIDAVLVEEEVEDTVATDNFL